MMTSDLKGVSPYKCVSSYELSPYTCKSLKTERFR